MLSAIIQTLKKPFVTVAHLKLPLNFRVYGDLINVDLSNMKGLLDMDMYTEIRKAIDGLGGHDVDIFRPRVLEYLSTNKIHWQDLDAFYEEYIESDNPTERTMADMLSVILDDWDNIFDFHDLSIPGPGPGPLTSRLWALFYEALFKNKQELQAVDTL